MWCSDINTLDSISSSFKKSCNKQIQTREPLLTNVNKEAYLIFLVKKELYKVKHVVDSFPAQKPRQATKLIVKMNACSVYMFSLPSNPHTLFGRDHCHS